MTQPAKELSTEELATLSRDVGAAQFVDAETVERLLESITTARRERDHWKANHDHINRTIRVPGFKVRNQFGVSFRSKAWPAASTK